MKAARFRYLRPESLEEALELLADSDGEASVIAGGQSLLPLMALRLATPEALIDIGRLPGLDELHEGADGMVEVGALVTHRKLETTVLSARNTVLTQVAAGIGHLPIRTRGTFGGSVAHGDPAADLPVVLRALDAQVELTSTGGTRMVSAEDFFIMPMMTAKEPDELVTLVRLPAPPEGEVRAAFQKFSRRAGDFAVVSAFARLVVDSAGVITHARVALGGVGGTPVRATAAEEALVGGAGERDAVGEAADLAVADIDPSGDVHASGGFRRHLARTLTERVLRSALFPATQEGHSR